jgi:NAD+ kinase
VEKVFKSVGLVARYDQKAALKLAEKLASYLAKKGLKVYIEDSLTDKVAPDYEFVPLSEMKTDLIITIGGDGTILRTAITVPKPEPPILAVNMGVRGFLTEVEPENAIESIERILNCDYKIEKCAKLCVTAGEETMPDALNDIVISAGEPSKILYAEIRKEDKPILKCQADGLIIATPTGSTGYNLSAGGPVLDSEVNAFVITPICSLTVFHSLVLPADCAITLNALRPNNMFVMIDGNYRKLITEDEPSVNISKSKNVTSFIRFETGFYDRLRNRLLFKGTE